MAEGMHHHSRWAAACGRPAPTSQPRFPRRGPRAVDTHAFADALVSKGYRRLVIQKGAGYYAPRVLVPPGGTSAVLSSGLEVE